MNLIKKKEISNRDRGKHENIFKIISKKTDTVCLNINKRGKQKCNSLKYFYEKNTQGNIEKYFIDIDLFNWEIDVYLYLVDKNIVPLSSTSNQKMIYYTNELKCLFTFLRETKTNTKCILNELFSFVNRFKKIHFVHGNLHLYNIFVDTLQKTDSVQQCTLSSNNVITLSSNNVITLSSNNVFVKDTLSSNNVITLSSNDVITLSSNNVITLSSNNVFVKDTSSVWQGTFSVIDFSNSRFKNKKRHLDISNTDEKCDLYLLYIELYNFYKGNDKIILYLKELLISHTDKYI